MSGDTGRTHQGLPALGLVPSGPEENNACCKERMKRENSRSVCSQQPWHPCLVLSGHVGWQHLAPQDYSHASQPNWLR